MTGWETLNERQRAYLTALYNRDRENEAYFAQERFDKPKASVWRWVAYHETGSDTGLQGEIDRLGMRDEGTGSTWEALAERGYLERRWETITEYSLMGGRRERNLLSLKLSPKGRKLCREVFGHSAKHVSWSEMARQEIADLLETPDGFYECLMVCQRDGKPFGGRRHQVGNKGRINVFQYDRNPSLVPTGYDWKPELIEAYIEMEGDIRIAQGGMTGYIVSSMAKWSPYPEWVGRFYQRLSETINEVVGKAVTQNGAHLHFSATTLASETDLITADTALPRSVSAPIQYALDALLAICPEVLSNPDFVRGDCDAVCHHR